MTIDKDWWKGAVIYQIYPRSFQDSNADGIGDLQGIITRLPYIKSLGADAVWISPFFKSPQKDFGYDISDYRDIDPQFGTLADCDEMIARAHDLGLKIIFDGVLSHTSEKHPWFQDSRNKRGGKDDWYVWADPKPDGSPPSNWVSIFGGPAWTFDPMRGQYYLHNFLKEQPDLNFHNPAVQDAMLDVARFWFDRGVDGLRLDTVNFYAHDPHLRDNPPRPVEMGIAVQHENRDPYSMQRHLYDKSQPENLRFVERLRAVADEFEGRFLMGEIGDDDPIARMSEYTLGTRRLHSAYSFALMGGTKVALNAGYIRNAIEAALKAGDGWPTWAFSNHDVPRPISRFITTDISNTSWAKLLIAILGSLRGTLCLYQGEELGLPESMVPQDRLQDPWGRHLWPVWQGRDGCRTPIPWDSKQPYAGFSSVEPWLPCAVEHALLSIAEQESNQESTLHFTRAMLDLRKKYPALIHGDIVFEDGPEGLLAFRRDNILCLFNLGSAEIAYPAQGKLLLRNQADMSGDTVSLGLFGFALVET